MFGRRGDEPNTGNRGGEGEQRPPQSRPGYGDGAEGAPFTDGLRVDTSRRRPLEGAATDAGAPPLPGEAPSVAVRHTQPLPAVPPSAGGAHRAAVYRTAPEPEAAPVAEPEPRPEPAPEVEAAEEAMAAATATSEGGEAMSETETGPQTDAGDSRKLIVGRGITLKGEIGNCDMLVVEGNVEANLSDCRVLEVGETGVLVGTVEVQEAVVAGRFKGKLTVADVLSIKRGGQVRGEVRYGALQVESGGVLAGSTATNDDDEEAPARPAVPGPGGSFAMGTGTPGGND